MCGVQLEDRKKMHRFDVHVEIRDIIDQLAMTNSVCWHGHVLRREDGHVFRRELHFEVEVQKGRTKRTWKKQVEE